MLAIIESCLKIKESVGLLFTFFISTRTTLDTYIQLFAASLSLEHQLLSKQDGRHFWSSSIICADGGQ